MAQRLLRISPVSQVKWKLRSVKSEHVNGNKSFKFVDEEWQTFIDAITSNIADLPIWIAPFYCDSKLDAWLGLPARAFWGCFQAQKVTNRALITMARYQEAGKEPSDERWQSLTKMVHKLSESCIKSCRGLISSSLDGRMPRGLRRRLSGL